MTVVREQLIRNEQSSCDVCPVGRPEGTALNFELEKKFNAELQIFILHAFLLSIAVYFSVRYNAITCDACFRVVTSADVWLSC
jgi:hypothetical protein